MNNWQTQIVLAFLLVDGCVLVALVLYILFGNHKNTRRF